MAIAYVQTVSAVGDAGATATTGAFGSNTTVGNVIIVVLDDVYSTSGFGFTHSCSDSKGNTYTKVFDKSDYGSGSSEVWWAPITTGGASHTVAASMTGGGYISIRAMEFSGIDTTAPFDKSSAQIAGGASFTSGSTATTAQADELLIGSIAYPPPHASSGAGGWTDLPEVGTGTGTDLQVSYKIVSATGTYAYTGTTDNGNARTVITTFKASGGGGGGGSDHNALSLLGVG